MTREGQAGAGELVAGYLTDYAALMEAHILKEDRFYKVTEPFLEAADHVELKAVFDKLEQETLGADGHAHYCQWAYQLADMRL
jgi:hemerythrin-like domain-containing protein